MLSNNYLGKAYPILRSFLDTVGDGSGSVNANGNYSVTPGVFKLVPPANTVYTIKQLAVLIADNGPLKADAYGLLALTNGIALQVIDTATSTVIADITAGVPVKVLHDYAGLGARIQVQDGTVNGYATALLDLPTAIQLQPTQALVATMADNLSGLVQHRLCAIGDKQVTSVGVTTP